MFNRWPVEMLLPELCTVVSKHDLLLDIGQYPLHREILILYISFLLQTNVSTMQNQSLWLNPICQVPHAGRFCANGQLQVQGRYLK